MQWEQILGQYGAPATLLGTAVAAASSDIVDGNAVVMGAMLVLSARMLADKMEKMESVRNAILEKLTAEHGAAIEAAEVRLARHSEELHNIKQDHVKIVERAQERAQKRRERKSDDK